MWAGLSGVCCTAKWTMCLRRFDVIKAGTKVNYKHGKGFSTGTALGKAENGFIEIETKNGSRVRRQADQVTKA